MIEYLSACAMPVSVFSGNAAAGEVSGFNARSSSSSSSTSTTPWSPSAHVSTVCDLRPALDLFLKVIGNDLPDMSPSPEFCLRLLTQTLDFLHQLLKDGLVRQGQLGGTEVEVAERGDLDEAMEVVMGYVARLRDAMLAHELRQKRRSRAVTRRSAGSVSSEAETGDSVSADSVDASSGSAAATMSAKDISSEVSFLQAEVGDRLSICLFVLLSHLCPEDIFRTTKLYATKRAVMVHHHGLGCCVKRFGSSPSRPGSQCGLKS